jgi:hypothetical protein
MGRALTADRPSFDAASFEVHGSAVLLRDTQAYVDRVGAPAATQRLAFGTALEVLSIERQANNTYWLEGQVAGTDQTLFVPISARTPRAPLELGHSLRELAVPPQGGALLDLVDPGPLTAALVNLRAAGKIVSWVSLASGPSADEETRDALEGRLAHVRYLFTRHGIDRRRVTSVSGAADVPPGWIRVRIFGY